MPPPEVPLYSVPNIALASFLGGPLAAGWLISVNYRRMNEPRAARSALIQGGIATLALVGLMVGLPPSLVEQVPGVTVPLIYTGLIWMVADRLQGRALAAHFARGGLRHSLWRAVGISLVAALPVAIVLLTLTALVPMTAPYDFGGEPVEVGESGDFIYPSGEIPAEVTETVGRVLTDEGVFVEGRPDVAGLRIENETFFLEVPVPLSSWSDVGMLSRLRRSQERLNDTFSGRPIEIVLVHQGVSGIQRRILGDSGLPTGSGPAGQSPE